MASFSWSVWVCLLVTLMFACHFAKSEEECTCLIALASASGFEIRNTMYNVTFKDPRFNCGPETSGRCSSRCQNGFLRSTRNGDLSQHSRQRPGVIGEHLCQALNRDVNGEEVGVYYRSCYDQSVHDSLVRASHNLCCQNGQYSAC